MGWYYSYDTTRAATIAELTAESKEWRTIRKFTSGNTLWTVHERKSSDGTNPDRFIGCYLIRRGSKGEWGYKPMDESMGPCELTCPLAYFELVPDPGGYATAWRERVRTYQARVHMHLRKGDIVKLTNGWEIIVTSPKPFRGLRMGTIYRIPRKMIHYKLVDRSGCREKVCYCHDPGYSGIRPFDCSGCGCRYYPELEKEHEHATQSA